MIVGILFGAIAVAALAYAIWHHRRQAAAIAEIIRQATDQHVGDPSFQTFTGYSEGSGAAVQSMRAVALLDAAELQVVTISRGAVFRTATTRKGMPHRLETSIRSRHFVMADSRSGLTFLPMAKDRARIVEALEALGYSVSSR